MITRGTHLLCEQFVCLDAVSLCELYQHRVTMFIRGREKARTVVCGVDTPFQVDTSHQREETRRVGDWLKGGET